LLTPLIFILGMKAKDGRSGFQNDLHESPTLSLM
jgi:hypothetical protein